MVRVYELNDSIEVDLLYSLYGYDLVLEPRTLYEAAASIEHGSEVVASGLKYERVGLNIGSLNIEYHIIEFIQISALIHVAIGFCLLLFHLVLW